MILKGYSVNRRRLKDLHQSLKLKEKDAGLESSLQTIMQSFDGRYLYPSLEEKATHLLYFW